MNCRIPKPHGRLLILVAALATLGATAAFAMQHAPTATEGRMPLFKNLGRYQRPIHTRSVMAQRYFDQGMNLFWSYSLEDAQRSFEEAVRLDTTSAAAWWGVAMSLSPHINFPGIPERTLAAHVAIEQAVARLGGASEVERALIEALRLRSSDPPPPDPPSHKPLDQAYAHAMRAVAQRFPDDDDVQALYADALMNLSPWDYWTKDGKPRPNTLEIAGILERVLARNPQHPGGNHYYIHAMEASQEPGKALAAARRLEKLIPDDGHMVHMPSHIYQRVGLYEASENSNRLAVTTDRAYFGLAQPPGFMFPMYAAHNIHFIAYAAMSQGRSAEALRHGRETVEFFGPDKMRAMPGTEFFGTVLAMARVRFAKWDELSSEPRPTAGIPYLDAIWHYARGRALAATGRLDEAATALDSLKAIASAIPAESMTALNSTRAVLAIATGSLAGWIAAGRGNTDEAVGLLEEAVKNEAALVYDEPYDWMIPVRHSLGEVLLQAKRAKQAEEVYRADLVVNPENGWALMGLAQSLRAQGRDAEAADVDKRFKKAWARADVKIAGSVL